MQTKHNLDDDHARIDIQHIPTSQSNMLLTITRVEKVLQQLKKNLKHITKQIFYLCKNSPWNFLVSQGKYVNRIGLDCLLKTCT